VRHSWTMFLIQIESNQILFFQNIIHGRQVLNSFFLLCFLCHKTKFCWKTNKLLQQTAKSSSVPHFTVPETTLIALPLWVECSFTLDLAMVCLEVHVPTHACVCVCMCSGPHVKAGMAVPHYISWWIGFRLVGRGGGGGFRLRMFLFKEQVGLEDTASQSSEHFPRYLMMGSNQANTVHHDRALGKQIEHW